MSHGRAILMSLCLIFAVALAPAKERKDAAVDTNSWGQVNGRVYDGRTGDPLRGATIVIQHDGQFAQNGKTTGRTDSVGFYHCQAPLGRISTKINAAALVTGVLPIGGMLGASGTTTNRIDVTQLILRVTRDGYRPFEGAVHCRQADAATFAVLLEPILLV
ncbi:MAG TPA: hypothetical protein VGM23_01290, partial [Armatimonadota bacterium]